jgi:hypothetical protein
MGFSHAHRSPVAGASQRVHRTIEETWMGVLPTLFYGRSETVGCGVRT